MSKIKQSGVPFGSPIWKTYREYYLPPNALCGHPYYQIRELNNVYYLWGVNANRELPDSPLYSILLQDTDYNTVREQAQKLENALPKLTEAEVGLLWPLVSFDVDAWNARVKANRG